MFSFRLQNSAENQLILFTSHLEGDEHFYSLEIERILKEELSKFENLVLLHPSFCQTEFSGWLKSEDSRLISNLTRGSDKQKVSVLSFDEYGRFTNWFNENCKADEFNIESLSKKIYHSGINKLLEINSNQVFLTSPAGTVFKKPSGKTSSIFIRTVEMAVGCSQIRFVALSLLSLRPKDVSIDSIYIDTSGISIYVEAIISLLSSFDNKYLNLNYKSFKSYTGLDRNFLPNSPKGVWVIISASLSNDLGKKIALDIPSVSNDQIVTILSPICQSEKFRGDRVLFDISKNEHYVASLSDKNPIMELEVCGENFYVPVKEPKEIVLKGVDKPKSIPNFIEKYKCGNFYSFDTYYDNKFRTYYLDFNKIELNELFHDQYKEWLNDFLHWKLPISIKSVICDLNDKASLKILKDVEDTAELSLNRYSFECLDGLSSYDGVLVISPVLSSGKKFSKLNSDLRLVNHNGMRAFLSPFTTFQDKQSFDVFKQSLCYGPKGLKYSFDCFQSVFLGDMNRSIWRSEEEFLQSRDAGIWEDRLVELGQRVPGDRKNVGLIAEGAGIGFTADFAFWEPGYSASDVNPATVFWTISSLLQAVRDFSLDPNKKDKSLFHNVNQYSVLDPENFSRFNDPLIQSCLWRAAYPHELNYSASNKLSERFLGILIKQVEEYLNGVKNGVLDLLLAVAMGHITLDSSCDQKLKSGLSEITTTCSRLGDLVLSITILNEEDVAEF
jgi:hypothetical protein